MKTFMTSSVPLKGSWGPLDVCRIHSENCLTNIWIAPLQLHGVTHLLVPYHGKEMVNDPTWSDIPSCHTDAVARTYQRNEQKSNQLIPICLFLLFPHTSLVFTYQPKVELWQGLGVPQVCCFFFLDSLPCIR